MLQLRVGRLEREHFGFGGWILPSRFVGLRPAWLRLWQLHDKATLPSLCLSFPIHKPGQVPSWPPAVGHGLLLLARVCVDGTAPGDRKEIQVVSGC